MYSLVVWCLWQMFWFWEIKISLHEFLSTSFFLYFFYIWYLLNWKEVIFFFGDQFSHTVCFGVGKTLAKFWTFFLNLLKGILLNIFCLVWCLLNGRMVSIVWQKHWFLRFPLCVFCIHIWWVQFIEDTYEVMSVCKIRMISSQLKKVSQVIAVSNVFGCLLV